MVIAPHSTYTTIFSTTGSQQPRQNIAGAPAASATNVAEKVTISQAAYAHAKEDTEDGSTYDFTKIPPKEIWPIAQNLYESGSLTRAEHLSMVSAALGPARQADSTRFENTPIDLIQYSKDRISFLESVGSTSDPQYGYETWKGLLSKLQAMMPNNVA